jgi:hypothetical protein
MGRLLFFGFALLLLSLRSSHCGEARPIPQKEGPAMQVDVRFKVNIEPKPDSLNISYEFVNTQQQPVLVFDRMWDRQKQALDPNWAHVEIRATKALISRSVYKKPEGLRFDNPPVPYGRVVEPEQSLKGSFSVPLPLEEKFTFYNFVRQTGEMQDLPVTEVAFALAWAPKPANLPPGIQPVDVGEDKGMLLLPYEMAISLQKLMISQPVRVNLTGRGKR